MRDDVHHASLTLDNVAISRGGLPLLDGVSITLDPGELLWLAGPNEIGRASWRDDTGHARRLGPPTRPRNVMTPRLHHVIGVAWTPFTTRS